MHNIRQTSCTVVDDYRLVVVHALGSRCGMNMVNICRGYNIICVVLNSIGCYQETLNYWLYGFLSAAVAWLTAGSPSRFQKGNSSFCVIRLVKPVAKGSSAEGPSFFLKPQEVCASLVWWKTILVWWKTVFCLLLALFVDMCSSFCPCTCAVCFPEFHVLSLRSQICFKASYPSGK